MTPIPEQVVRPMSSILATVTGTRGMPSPLGGGPSTAMLTVFPPLRRIRSRTLYFSQTWRSKVSAPELLAVAQDDANLLVKSLELPDEGTRNLEDVIS